MFPPITGDPIVDTIIWSEELSDSDEQSQQSVQSTTVQETQWSNSDSPAIGPGIPAGVLLGFLVFALVLVVSYYHWRAKDMDSDRVMTLEEFKKFKKLHAANKRRWDRR